MEPGEVSRPTSAGRAEQEVLKLVTAPGMLMCCSCCPLIPIFVTPHTD